MSTNEYEQALELLRHWQQIANDRSVEIHRLNDELERLRADGENLRTVMVAAAEEIHQHWEAHCDADGYGPANLMHRLEIGIPSQYAYKAGDFARLKEENERLRAHGIGAQAPTEKQE